jgi:hypothetical protein
MKYLIFLLLAGCGEEASRALSEWPQKADNSAEVLAATEHYYDLCITRGLATIEARRAPCEASLGHEWCTDHLENTTHELSAYWNSGLDYSTRQLVECNADFRSTAEYCVQLYDETLRFNSSLCDEIASTH